ncbi:MAG: sugar phosphate isomerase/epimerase, partial [Parvularculaceae bacterium]|nr:sugar phosphate isomerase/epimerase [Parvularculaceae bacterium]
MKNRLGIELLTLLGMPPDQHVRLAAELGCVAVSTALSGVPLSLLGVRDFAPWPAWSLETDADLARAFKAALRETGVHIALAEGFRIRPDADVGDRARQLDLMAEFGARRVNAVGTDPDPARSDDQFAKLCEMAVARGMTMTIEFAPPNAVATLGQALAAAARVGRPECRILLDSMHFFRSGATLDDLAALPPDRIGY